MPFKNPSLRFSSFEDIVNSSPIHETDSSVFAVAKIGLLKSLMESNNIKYYHNNRGAQKFSPKTISNVEKRLFIHSLKAITLSVNMEKKYAMIIDGNSRIKGILNRVLVERKPSVILDKDIGICLIPWGVKEDDYRITNQCDPHTLKDALSNSDLFVGNNLEKLLNEHGKTITTEPLYDTIFDIFIAYVNDYFKDVPLENPLHLLRAFFKGRKFLKDIVKTGESFEVDKKKYAFFNEGLSRYYEVMNKLKHTRTSGNKDAAKKISQSRGVLAVFLIDYLLKGYTYDITLPVLIQNIRYDLEDPADKKVIDWLNTWHLNNVIRKQITCAESYNWVRLFLKGDPRSVIRKTVQKEDAIENFGDKKLKTTHLHVAATLNPHKTRTKAGVNIKAKRKTKIAK